MPGPDFNFVGVNVSILKIRRGIRPSRAVVKPPDVGVKKSNFGAL